MRRLPLAGMLRREAAGVNGRARTGALLYDLLPYQPAELQIRAYAALERSGDRGAIPALIELLRFDLPVPAELPVGVLEKLSGQPFGAAWPRWVEWLQRQTDRLVRVPPRRRGLRAGAVSDVLLRGLERLRLHLGLRPDRELWVSAVGLASWIGELTTPVEIMMSGAVVFTIPSWSSSPASSGSSAASRPARSSRPLRALPPADALRMAGS